MCKSKWYFNQLTNYEFIANCRYLLLVVSLSHLDDLDNAKQAYEQAANLDQ